MAKINTKPENRKRTHEGAPAFPHLKPIQQLRRSVLSCLLWEKEFYEDGESIADRITNTAKQCAPGDVASLAIEAREQFNLRHAPLLLLESLTHIGSGSRLVGDTIERVIQRADEPGELLAILKARGMGRTVPKQVKIGLSRALKKFDEYQLAKYDRAAQYRLRDVMFLTHPKPNGNGETERLKRLAEQELQTPDTWEVALSGGADKKETFERLLREQKLGYLALLRNLRNMVEAGVDEELVRAAILARKGAKRILPFRYMAAVAAAPMYARELDKAMLASIAELEPLGGRTIVAVDTSGSMTSNLSAKSMLRRVDAAATLASMINGNVRLLSFATNVEELPFYRGLAGIQTLHGAIGRVGHGTDIGLAMHRANSLPHERLILVTDEQSHTRVPDPMAKYAYVINVASYQNGVGYGKWTHIDGFSESVIRFIAESERCA